MKYLFIFIFLVSFASCKVKDPCEIQNEGQLCVTNNTSGLLTVYIETSKIMEIPKGERKCIDKNVGVYNLKCFQELEKWEKNNILIKQCETTYIAIP